MRQEKGCYMTAFGWEGIGLNEMIKTAFRVAEVIKAGVPLTWNSNRLECSEQCVCGKKHVQTSQLSFSANQHVI